MEQQTEYSFDSKTRGKIYISMVIATIAPAVVGLLDFFGQIHFHSDKPYLDYILIYIVPVLLNALREYVNGLPAQFQNDEPIEVESPNSLG